MDPEQQRIHTHIRGPISHILDPQFLGFIQGGLGAAREATKEQAEMMPLPSESDGYLPGHRDHRHRKGLYAMEDNGSVAASVATLIDSTTCKIQQLQRAFTELESHSAVTLNLKWKELEEHFHGLENSLKTRFNELEDQENEYVIKITETEDMLEKREAIVVAKEQASLEKLQEKRDVTLSMLYGKCTSHTSVPMNMDGMHKFLMEERADMATTKICEEVVTPARKASAEDKPRSEVIKLCEEMDAEGLHKFISDNRKNLASIREEIPDALRSATDPFSLVLNSLKDFYSGEFLGFDGKKDANILGLRRTCLMLMECLGQLLGGVSGSSGDSQMLKPALKKQAKAIANEWKPKLDDLDVDASSGNSLEAHAFLQLLATFGIVSEFDQNEICNLIPTVSRRRQTADLCRSLGLSRKMPGVIDTLIKTGKQIDAVNLAYAFELTGQFAPVPLLKAYLKEARKVLQVKAGNSSPGTQNETNERELSALKAVIKCIEDHKLEEEYPVDPRHKRILQLEKAKADKRRAAEAAKPQSKRPRANGSTYAPRVTSFPEKSFYLTPERHPYPYERPYVYPSETYSPPLLGTSPYHITHSFDILWKWLPVPVHSPLSTLMVKAEVIVV